MLFARLLTQAQSLLFPVQLFPEESMEKKNQIVGLSRRF